jgi:hypothetical protein
MPNDASQILFHLPFGALLSIEKRKVIYRSRHVRFERETGKLYHRRWFIFKEYITLHQATNYLTAQ